MRLHISARNINQTGEETMTWTPENNTTIWALLTDDLIERAEKEIERLEAKANQMVADKINLRSELISVQAKLAVAVEALERIASGALSGYVLTSNPPQDPAEAAASATLAKIKGEKH